MTTVIPKDNLEEYYETLIFDRNMYKDTILDSLEMVKNFIKSNNRILVGGMAIDLAFRSVGSKLYEDNKLPDYDFVSDTFFQDAYDIGNMLATKYSNISVINAFHATTMRVRVDFQEAADITYVPTGLYSKIPTIDYQGFKIVHPYYQMIDQHRSLSTPFENPPNETYKGRWKKDIIRYGLLCKHFPVKPNDRKFKFTNNKYDIGKLTKNYPICIGGYAGVAYWIQQAKADGYESSDQNLHWDTIDDKQLSCDVPYLTVLSDGFLQTTDDIMDSNSTIVRYHSIMDKINCRNVVTKTTDKAKTNSNVEYEIIDNKGHMRSAHKILDKVYVGNLQTLMCELLTKDLLLSDKDARNAYLLCVNIVNWAGKEKKAPSDKYSKYLPSLEVFGTTNVYSSIIINKKRISAYLDGVAYDRDSPPNVYLGRGKKVNEKHYDFVLDSFIYNIDGGVYSSSSDSKSDSKSESEL